MLKTEAIRPLDLATSGRGRTAGHVSAASGLVCTGQFLYVIADDALHLGCFRAAGSAPGRLVRLFEGELPEDPVARKALKPDLETLTMLPAFADYPHGALLTIGSGSTRNRTRGCLLRLDHAGGLIDSPRIIDAAGLFETLANRLPAPNVEGMVAIGDEFRLLQRANTLHRRNAVIRYPLAVILEAMQHGVIGNIEPSAIDPIDLGTIGNVPLTFTDGAALPNGDMVFTAVAEDTSDPYHDGLCTGAAIGVLARNGAVKSMAHLDHAHKVEGVAVRGSEDGQSLLLVTDADDPAIPAILLSVQVPAPR